MGLGDVIEPARRAKNLTQRDLAEKVGISHAQVALLETGESKNPTLRTLWRLSMALSLPVLDVVLAGRDDALAETRAEYRAPKGPNYSVRGRLIAKLERSRYGQIKVTEDTPAFYAAAQLLVTEGRVERVSWEQLYVKKGPRPEPGKKRRRRWQIIIRQKLPADTPDRRNLPPGAYPDGEI